MLIENVPKLTCTSALPTTIARLPRQSVTSDPSNHETQRSRREAVEESVTGSPAMSICHPGREPFGLDFVRRVEDEVVVDVVEQPSLSLPSTPGYLLVGEVGRERPLDVSFA
jgi:hypothetical protein